MGSLPIELLTPTYEQGQKPGYQRTSNKDIFIVHGYDEMSKVSLANFLRKIGLNPIILHEQPNKGMTIIEKFEQSANLAGYAFV